MGTRYTTESLTGYNSSPPVDDGSQTEANKVKWATHKDKLGDPLKTQVANIDAKLVAMADIGPDAKTSNYTTLTGDHQKTIEVTSASVTITLLAVSTAPAGYTITVKNSSGTTTVIDATGSETIDGSTDTVTLTDDENFIVQLNAAGDGYISLKQIEQIGKGADIASATALTLGSDGKSFDVTGTTTITSIDTVKIGFHVTLQFDDALILTHHATNLILPGAANITTAAGDIAVFWEYATGDWQCVSYTKADGTATIINKTLASGLLYNGSGDDGAGPSTTTTLDSGEYHYTSWTLNSGQTIDVTEATGGWLIIRCTGTVTIIGTIDLDGKGSAGGVSQTSASTDGNTGTAGTGGATGGGGGSSDSTDKGGAGGVSSIRGISIAGGAQSPNGPNGAGGAGVAVSARLQTIIQSQAGLELYKVNGSGGGSGGYRTGTGSGKGGNGGGSLIIVADTIDFQSGAVITCDGADGDPVTDSINGSGGGGGGGVAVLAASTITNSGTLTVTGGSGGADSGNAGVGGVGGAGYSEIITG